MVFFPWRWRSMDRSTLKRLPLGANEDVMRCVQSEGDSSSTRLLLPTAERNGWKGSRGHRRWKYLNYYYYFNRIHSVVQTILELLIHSSAAYCVIVAHFQLAPCVLLKVYRCARGELTWSFSGLWAEAPAPCPGLHVVGHHRLRLHQDSSSALGPGVLQNPIWRPLPNKAFFSFKMLTYLNLNCLMTICVKPLDCKTFIASKVVCYKLHQVS